MTKCPVCGSENSKTSSFCSNCGYNFTGTQTGQLNTNTILEDRYIIVRTLGKGGMGAVYHALDRRLNNSAVAIKEMSTRAVGGDLQGAISAFQKEAAMLVDLRHPALPRINDFFCRGEDRWYLVMDYIEGQTLKDIAESRGPIPESEVLEWGRQLCAILDYLHKRKPPVIFRDLKPANIMLTPEGQIKLIDFGIARHFRVGGSSDTIAYGSKGYAPPEQYGENQTDPRSDIYALGVTLHALLTGIDPGKTPFVFNLPSKTVKVSSGFERAIMTALELEPEKRPASVREMLEMMGSGVEGAGTEPADEFKTARIGDGTLASGISLVDAKTELAAVWNGGVTSATLSCNDQKTKPNIAVNLPQKDIEWKQWVTVFVGIILLVGFALLIFYRGSPSGLSPLSSKTPQASKTGDSKATGTDADVRSGVKEPDQTAVPETVKSSVSAPAGMASTLIVDANGARWEWIEGDPNARTGKVKITWNNGNVYSGEVQKGVISGNGEYTTTDNEHYVGQFANNTMNGVGTLSSLTGTWTGTFKDGLLDYGHFEASDKSLVYDGQFANFMFDGQGTAVFSDGARYEGEFKNGVKEGTGTYTYPDGATVSGEWRNDTLVKQWARK